MRNSTRFKDDIMIYKVRQYSALLYKIQHLEILVEYEKSFDIDTGKLIINPNPTHHISNRDKHMYIPVTFLKKTQEEMVESFVQKTKAVHIYKNYHF